MIHLNMNENVNVIDSPIKSFLFQYTFKHFRTSNPLHSSKFRAKNLSPLSFENPPALLPKFDIRALMSFFCEFTFIQL